MKNDSNNAAKQMIARYPDLKPYPKSAAENLRRELRAVFPQITFSVRYKSFSGGDEITVSYEDGPKVEEVEAIANKYAYDSSQCDAMTDYYDYRPTEFTRIFGGAKFVLIRRDMSDRVRADLCCKAVEIAPDLADGRNVRREELFSPGEMCASVELFEATRGLCWVTADSIARNLFNKMSFA